MMGGPVQQIGPLLDAKSAAFSANGIKAATPQSIKNYLAARTSAINRELAQFRSPFACTGPASQESLDSQFKLTGIAPFEVETIRINDVPLPVVWTTATNWSITVPLIERTNRLAVAGFDSTGKALPSAAINVTVIFLGASPLNQPTLRIASIIGQQRNEAVLTWTNIPGTSYRLESTTNLSDRDWQDVPIIEGATSLQLPLTNPAAFFRLVKP